jgi:hypothetical protein
MMPSRATPCFPCYRTMRPCLASFSTAACYLHRDRPSSTSTWRPPRLNALGADRCTRAARDRLCVGAGVRRPEMAARRELNILAAGSMGAIERVQPLFDALGKKTWRLGDEPCNANVAKIAGNLMVACMLESMGEAAALARAYRMQPADLLDVVVGSLFDVPFMPGSSPARDSSRRASTCGWVSRTPGSRSRLEKQRTCRYPSPAFCATIIWPMVANIKTGRSLPRSPRGAPRSTSFDAIRPDPRNNLREVRYGEAH